MLVKRMKQSKATVYLCGAHCAGKTTLMRSLQAHPEFSTFGFYYQEEVARPWIAKRGLTPEELRDSATLLEFEKEILEIQCLAEEHEVEDCAGRFSRFLWDRGIIDPLGYTKAFVGEKKADELLEIPHVKQMLEKWRRGDECLVFVIKPERDFIENDGVRRECNIDELMTLHNAMIYYLEKLDIPHTVISCREHDKRRDVVLQAVKEKWKFNEIIK